MDRLDKIRQALADRRIGVVVAATGLHRNTIAAVRDGKATPTIDTLDRLARYLGIGE